MRKFRRYYDSKSIQHAPTDVTCIFLYSYRIIKNDCLPKSNGSLDFTSPFWQTALGASNTIGRRYRVRSLNVVFLCPTSSLFSR